MAGVTPKFEVLLKKWPVNNFKSNCYGRHLRELFVKHSADGKFFPGTDSDNMQSLDSLIRLADNKYGKKYFFSNKTGCTGLELEDLNVALTDKFIDNFNKKWFG